MDQSRKLSQPNQIGEATLPRVAGSIDASIAVALPQTSAVLRTVVEKHNRYFLVPIKITHQDTVETVVERTLAVQKDVVRCIAILQPFHDLIWGQRIAVATLSTFQFTGALSPGRPLEVNIRHHEACADLNRPDLLDDTESFTSLYPDMLEGSLSRKAILVERKLKRENVLRCALVALIVALVAGLLVGFLTHHFAAGIGTSAGIVGTVAFLVQLSTWVVE
ncbi:hypothetical protein F5Y15DRAFT_421530 [Xylariaceae sp. FL0016]|nr:hypothetical protein F5Y15DRAFT_421530 [Xylariaceae sp. FL0016]